MVSGLLPILALTRFQTAFYLILGYGLVWLGTSIAALHAVLQSMQEDFCVCSGYAEESASYGFQDAEVSRVIMYTTTQLMAWL